MFASFSAGEYGSVGATEWLEVRLARFATQPHQAAVIIQDVGVYSGLSLISEHESLLLHQPGWSHSRYFPRGSRVASFFSVPLCPSEQGGAFVPSQVETDSKSPPVP